MIRMILSSYLSLLLYDDSAGLHRARRRLGRRLLTRAFHMMSLSLGGPWTEVASSARGWSRGASRPQAPMSDTTDDVAFGRNENRVLPLTNMAEDCNDQGKDAVFVPPECDIASIRHRSLQEWRGDPCRQTDCPVRGGGGDGGGEGPCWGCC